MTARTITRTTFAAITLLLMAALPVLAETGSGESPDFTVNTVPEPAALIAIVGALLLARKARTKAVALVAVLVCATFMAMPLLATPPVVSNVTAVQSSEGGPVEIYYDLYDADGDTCEVWVTVSTNSGDGYGFPARSFSNDIGGGIKASLPGSLGNARKATSKRIIWSFTNDMSSMPLYGSIFLCPTMRVNISANDTPGTVLVPGGQFAMGNCMDPTEGWPSELPVHAVMVSAFIIDRKEVSYALWSNVYAWAATHGFAFDNPGSGKATNHPVHAVNWYDSVKWCNARSEKEGLTPCYYTDAAQTAVYRTGQVNLSNEWVNWTASGYRLPTEAEWEKAARGGTPGHRFPWSDSEEIQHGRAVYYSNTNYANTIAYDTSPTFGHHPKFTNDPLPYTGPVGYSIPNGYGLHDVAGNVSEWCWDWNDDAWYGNPDASLIDTRGPAMPSWSPSRVMRGSSYNGLPDGARCAARSSGPANFAATDDYGFRCVRGTTAPLVDVTNANATVGYNMTATSIGGMNNPQVVGRMTWANQLTGGTGTFAAVASWVVSNISLGVGINKITVSGTNTAGTIARDSVNITRDNIEGMVLIPAGPFDMGNDTNLFPELYTNEWPVHTVMISAFFMDKGEVTYSRWSNVYAWAVTHGYAFDNPGLGRLTNHPINKVSWYDCVKWCNARSEKEGQTPCYYTDAAQTAVYRTGQVNLSNEWVNWTASGYRLPTEAEWEKAARGGTPGHRFPWSEADTITHARANYIAWTNNFVYDVNPQNGYNPAFTNEPVIVPILYTSPVGYFAPNGYGLYGMAGNVQEWCWDRHDELWYNNAGAAQDDTRGPASGNNRVKRGGNWGDHACVLRCVFRSGDIASLITDGTGLRCVKGLPDGMALIPAGPFDMGNDTNLFPELYINEWPVHTVMVSAFFMDRYEVTYTSWMNVHTWATNNGYTFDNAGLGKATNHPVQTVNWYDCVKWCNARSEMQGLTPCYYTNAAQTLVYRSGAENLSNDRVNWSANGYRLPTEAEWEKAARGGTPGHRFPWSDADTIDHTRANFYNGGGESYATGTTGYHPTFAVGGFPCTSPVGYFAPNGYGLYDMAGNVWEWTWDWYDGAWYSNAGATQSDTPGLGSGTYRVLRGGNWGSIAGLSRVANRISRTPGNESDGIGFRSVRR